MIANITVGKVFNLVDRYTKCCSTGEHFVRSARLNYYHHVAKTTFFQFCASLVSQKLACMDISYTRIIGTRKKGIYLYGHILLPDLPACETKNDMINILFYAILVMDCT